MMPKASLKNSTIWVSRLSSSELDTLDTQVKSLIEQWDGAAREAYHQAQRDWNGKLQEMNQILGQISQATSQIAQQYVESDARSAGRF